MGLFSKWPRPAPARPGEINYNTFDRFTLVHFGVGILYAWFKLSCVTAFLLAVGWELVENPLKLWLPILFPHATADTISNSVGDVIAVLFGWWIFHKIRS